MMAIFPAMSRSIKRFFAHPGPNSAERMRLAAPRRDALLWWSGMDTVGRCMLPTAGTIERQRSVVLSA